MNKLPKGWDELQKKFSEYLSIIARDHHKNRDGKLTLSYEYNGWIEEGGWVVLHDGYVNDFCIIGRTPEETIAEAIKELEKLIQTEKEIVDANAAYDMWIQGKTKNL